MAEQARTAGETLFEQYLATQDLPFEFEKKHAGKSKKPDYIVNWRGNHVVFDVKDFDAPDEHRAGFAAFDPYPRIREKIQQGRNKFREYKEVCCSLVLYNRGQPLVNLQTPDIMLGSMYGDVGFTFPVNTSTGVGDADKMKRSFLGRGKMVRPHWSQPQNTTISAIITLSTVRPHYQLLVEMIQAEKQREIAECEAELAERVPDYNPDLRIPRVIVWHNAVARIGFPDDLFRGPYDTHFGVVREENGIVKQVVTYRGRSLPASVKV
jgi:hypothetical protein